MQCLRTQSDVEEEDEEEEEEEVSVGYYLLGKLQARSELAHL